MKKKILVYLLIILSTFFIFNFSAKTFGLDCAEGYTQIKDGNCYNPTTKLSYNPTTNYFYFMDFDSCGKECDFNGKNCKEGICSCVPNYILKRKTYEPRCYNSPDNSLSYRKSPHINQNLEFYKYDDYCGFDCDYDGRNCKGGVCNIADCAEGYTEIKNGRCYNPQNSLSYIPHEKVKVFYLNEKECGQNCDYAGKNCEKGVCNKIYCPKIEGYTQLKNGNCYNPTTKLSYDSNRNFYIEEEPCGQNCDFNGRNCVRGNCNVKDCAEGYIQLKDGKCYNPETRISYGKQSNKEIWFYFHGRHCGINCNFDGRHCKTGVCRAEDCHGKYNNIFYTDYTGFCIDNNGNKRITFGDKIYNLSLGGPGPDAIIILLTSLITQICFLIISCIIVILIMLINKFIKNK